MVSLERSELKITIECIDVDDRQTGRQKDKQTDTFGDKTTVVWHF